MQWIEVTIKTAPGAIDLVCDRLTVLGFDSFIVDDQDQFHEFLEENRQYWDYVDEGLEQQMQGLSQIRLYLEEGPAVPETISHLRSRIQRAGGVDILVTHAPLHGYGDFSDLPHRGFTVFNEILDTYHPALMLHGHIHLTYGANIPREHQYGQTRIVNCYERFTLDLPDKPDPRRHSLIERWKQFNRTGHF